MTLKTRPPRLIVKQTPCIGVCSTVTGDNVCRGCKRYSHEIIGWNSYADEQRRAVYQRLDKLLSQVIDDKIVIFDEDKLLRKLAALKVRVNDHELRCSWIIDLLQTNADKINDLTAFGCRVLPYYQHLSIPDLYMEIDAAFYTLSGAHFERYFVCRTML